MNRPLLQKFPARKLFILATFIAASFSVGITAHESEGASLSEVSVTLSNSRLSFSGALDGNNAVSTSEVSIDTTVGDYPSTSSAQLLEGDTVSIGEAGSMADYTITDVPTDSTFNVTPVLASGDADEGDVVISTQSATLTNRFTTTNAIQNGRFRILVPALDDDGDAADGLPDGGAFDMGSSTPTVTCPSDLTGYDFVAGTATASAVTVDGAQYHSFECAYSGTGAIGTEFDGTNEDAIVIDSLINPAPESDHAEGTADTYRVIVQHLDSDLNVDDSTTVAIGVIEAVRVTASVAPQITFRIMGVAATTTACGVATDVTTTPASVPLGELAISDFTEAAQGITVSTNAINGYSVTALANDQLGRDGKACTANGGDPLLANDPECIQDSRGDNSSMSHTAKDEWDSSTNKGFAYSLDNVNAVSGYTPAFEYDDSDGNCSGTYCAKQFADNQGSEAAQTIFSATSVADNHNLYVCYRAVIAASQGAGNYENNITYTATATF